MRVVVSVGGWGAWGLIRCAYQVLWYVGEHGMSPLIVVGLEVGVEGAGNVARKVSVSEQVRSSVAVMESPKVEALRRRRKRQGEDAGRGKNAGWRRGPADDQLLDFLVRFEALTEAQAAQWFYGGSLTRAKRRIGFMLHSGLVRKYHDFPAVGIVVIPTPAAGRAVYGRESPLAAVKPPSHSRITHLLFVAQSAASIMFDPTHPREVISEREIRLFHDRGDEAIRLLLESRGVTLAPSAGARGVWPMTAPVTRRREGRDVTVEHRFWITVRTGGVHATYRIPDFIEVRNGDMWAVEVELSEKDTYRIKEILAGYRDCTLHHAPVDEHTNQKLGDTGRPIYSQFRGVRWICSDDIADRLTGPHKIAPRDITDNGRPDGQVIINAGTPVYGINPATDAPAPGLVEEVWAKSATGRLMFRDLPDKAMTNDRRPVTVERVNVDAQPGLEYLLSQAVLSPRYHADFTEWGKWRKLWADAVADDTSPVGFTRWLRHDANFSECIRTTRGQNRALVD